ncbi:putative addiction module component [compost metagenome]
MWDSVATHPENLPPLSDEERREIDRRLAEHDAAPDTAVAWEDVRKRLWSGLK